MRKTAFYAFALLLCCLSCRGQQPSAAVQVAPSAPVKPGIEVLRERGFEGLKGKRVGLLTNPSGVDRNLKSTVDILFEAPEVNLVALFAPEHGVRGDVYAGGKVESGRDETTGLPVHSVYGATRKPTPEMLRGLDIVVYDIQDVGTRSYTFISSLGLMMSACAELGIEVMVLDRPNPLGGRKVEGSLVEPGFYSFVSQYPIPYIYGLTAGEVATFINEEGVNLGQKGTDPFHKCKLTVVPMEGWRRDMRFTDTGLPWILPSPNIPYPQTAIDYPCSGLVGECPGFLNIGIGYSLPFELFAAPLDRRGQAQGPPGQLQPPRHRLPHHPLHPLLRQHARQTHPRRPILLHRLRSRHHHPHPVLGHAGHPRALPRPRPLRDRGLRDVRQVRRVGLHPHDLPPPLQGRRHPRFLEPGCGRLPRPQFEVLPL